MFCPADANTGLVQLVGPIAASDLKGITNSQAPLSIKFEPRSTPPTLTGNQIEESEKNTCTYNAQKFFLESVQIVTPVHTGFNLPGNTDTPIAELILSFCAISPPSSSLQLAGLLMCLPIYESSSTSHDAYLNQIFENDPTKPNNASLESLFYSSDTDTSQVSLGYRTCFETQDDNENIGSSSIYVLVFPNGIRLASASYRMPKSSLLTYQLPSGLRGNNATVRKYTIDDNGQKKATQIDQTGVMYTTPISSCSDEFKNGRFEYFTFPPQIPFTSSSSKFATTQGTTQGTCPTPKQYTCRPFNQLRDEKGDYTKVSDGTCLKDIIDNRATSSSFSSFISNSNDPSPALSTADMEDIAGGVLAGTLIMIAVVVGVSWYTKSKE